MGTPRRAAVWLLLAMLLLAGMPAMRDRVTSLAVLAEALDVPFPRPFARDVGRAAVRLDGVAGDLYYPGLPAQALVLVPGAAPQGKDDPRVVRTARAIARAGRVVFVPTLELYGEDLVEEDIERIVRSTAALHGHPLTRGRPAIFGLSFGGSFGLIAASDARLRGRVSVVAVFGAYWDLRGLVQAITTGVSVVGNREVPYEPHPLADEILDEVALELVEAQDRALLESVLAGERPPADLPPGPAAVHELVRNRDPARTFELARRLPPEARRVLETFSPSSFADRIEAPVIALHSTDDPAVAFGEVARLAGDLPRARVVAVSVFEHVDPVATEEGWTGALRDVLRVWRFATWLLGAR